MSFSLKSFRVLAMVPIFSINIFSSLSFALPEENSVYPLGPVETVTPGSLCDRPNSYRYPEKIAYCDRDVDTSVKAIILKKYQGIGYTFSNVKRSDYKIDHLIPLCMGGSNHQDNLWPQYRKVFEITDDLERILCEKMAAGVLTQAKAMVMILNAKTDLKMAEPILDEAKSLQ